MTDISKWPDWFSFDPEREVVTMFGIKYAVDFFRAFGVEPAGYTFKVIERSDGVVTIGQERNALEAAAPDMLALLQELIDIEGPQPGTADWAEKVHAAIAKATGKTLASGLAP